MSETGSLPTLARIECAAKYYLNSRSEGVVRRLVFAHGLFMVHQGFGPDADLPLKSVIAGDGRESLDFVVQAIFTCLKERESVCS